MRTLLVVGGLGGLLLLGACDRDAKPTPTTTSSSAASAATTASAETKPTGVIAVGSPAPSFTAKAHDGTTIQPSALKGKNVVLYFYPKDETSGCTKEAEAFRDSWKDLASTGVVVVGISTDNEASHKSFAENHKLPFHLVSDTDGSIAKAYGVPNNGGFLARHTIVIGPDGNVKKIYRSVDVSKHAAEILADVKS
jgi:peroxiredoxin Q/BCP